jgi:parvulin-like peptidyl-prolyl isomerase
MMNQPKRAVLSAILLGVACVGAVVASDTPPSAATQPAAPPLAVVNGEPILPGDVARELQRIHGSVEQTDRNDLDLDRLMFRMVNDLLIAQEARALGLDDEPTIVEKVRKKQDDLVLAHLDRTEVIERAEPTDDEVRRLFEEQHRVVELRVVSSLDEETARENLAELRDGADMEQMARERSVDPIQIRGGLMKPAPRIELLKGVGDAAFASEVGELAGPIQTKLGWTVLRVESFAEADESTFPTLEPGLRALLRQEKAKRLRAELAAQVRRHHEFRIDREAIDAIQPVREADARLLAKPEDPAAVLAYVGERRVLADDYAKALIQKWKGVRNIEFARAAAPMILERLVERALLLAEADRRGLSDLPEIRNPVRAYERQLLVPRYLEEVLAPTVEIEDADLRQYYEQNLDAFRRPPRVRLGQLTVATLEEAQRMAQSLRDGSDLGWLAKQYSGDEYAERGGDRGWLSPEPEADEFQDWLLGAERGSVADPIPVGDAFVVVKLLDREQQDPYPYERVSGNVREAVFGREFTERLDRFIKTLRGRSEIEVHEDRLARLNIAGTADLDPGGGAGGHGAH